MISASNNPRIRPRFGYSPDKNFNCDDPTHGYDCYHLDEDMGKLTDAEIKEYLKELMIKKGA